MSYEGWEQYLCEQGHYSSCNCYESGNIENIKCEHCGSKIVWWNSVDTTNGSYCECDLEDGCEYCKDGRIDGYVELEVLEEEKTETCTCCNHVRFTKPAKYKIPKDKGHKI